MLPFEGKIMRKPNALFIGIFCLAISLSMNASTFDIVAVPDAIKSDMKTHNTWREGCPVPIDRLKLIQFSYYNFNGQEQQDGQIIVLDAVGPQVRKIFKELHSIKFPIAQAKLIEHYKGNDDSSMAENNTSCFNCREITGGGSVSIHSYGLAIDINPIQNPFISFEEKGECSTQIKPAAGKEYINRSNLRAGMAENVVEIFKNNGFGVWGGKWNTPIDWQHFQLPRPVAQLLATMSSKDAISFFELYASVKSPKMFEGIKSENKFVQLYQKNPRKFMVTFENNPKILELETSEALGKMVAGFNSGP
jgi:D-alanyl-D-alanine carboxypeptidase